MIGNKLIGGGSVVMLIEAREEYKKLCLAFLQGEKKLPIPKNCPFKNGTWSAIIKSGRAELLTNILFYHWQQLSPIEKIYRVQGIEHACKTYQQEVQQTKISKENPLLEIIRQKCKALKTANWKEAMFELNLAVHHDVYNYPITYDRSAAVPLDIKERLHIMKSQDNRFQQSSYALIGTTFMTNRKAILGNNSKIDGHILDAFYSAYVLDDKNNPTSVIIGLADGCGGHFGDYGQDLAIANVSHLIVREFARYFALYKSADELKTDLPHLIKVLEDKIGNKLGTRQKEGATVIVARAFRSKNNQYRVIGISLGDSMLCAWSNNTFYTIEPARLSIINNQQEATAIFPTNYSSNEMHTIDVELPTDTILIPMSDGLHDLLPLQRQTRILSDKMTTSERSIDTNAQEIKNLLEQMTKTITIPDLLTTLLNFVQIKLETERQKQLSQSLTAEKELPQALLQAEQNKKILELEEEQLHAEIKQKEDLRKDTTLENKLATLHTNKKSIFQRVDDLAAQQSIQIGDDVSAVFTFLPK
jgi:serine/threonine protein phosphatase PrpC